MDIFESQMSLASFKVFHPPVYFCSPGIFDILVHRFSQAIFDTGNKSCPIFNGK